MRRGEGKRQKNVRENDTGESIQKRTNTLGVTSKCILAKRLISISGYNEPHENITNKYEEKGIYTTSQLLCQPSRE